MDQAKRNSLPESEFALPGQRKYPVDTRGRAANAKSRATQMENAGKLSATDKEKVDRKANAVLMQGTRFGRYK